MKSYYLFLLGFLGFVNSIGWTQDSIVPERILWQKKPIPIAITIGQEKIIHFPDDIRYWVSDYVKDKANIVAANGVLYITALVPFEKNRIHVQSISDQRIYLLDILTTDINSQSNEIIITNAERVDNTSDIQFDALKSGEDWRIRLSRYAAQQLYAPTRLLPTDTQIKRIDIDNRESIALIRGERFISRPLAAWSGGGYTVVAIELKNRLAQSFNLGFKPQAENDRAVNLGRLIRGSWLTATLQHRFIGPIGSDADTTTLYLVSKHADFGLQYFNKPVEGGLSNGE